MPFLLATFIVAHFISAVVRYQINSSIRHLAKIDPDSYREKETSEESIHAPHEMPATQWACPSEYRKGGRRMKLKRERREEE